MLRSLGAATLTLAIAGLAPASAHAYVYCQDFEDIEPGPVSMPYVPEHHLTGHLDFYEWGSEVHGMILDSPLGGRGLLVDSATGFAPFSGTWRPDRVYMEVWVEKGANLYFTGPSGQLESRRLGPGRHEIDYFAPDGEVVSDVLFKWSSDSALFFDRICAVHT